MNPAAIRARTYSRWYEDGLAEIAMGVIFLLISCYMLLFIFLAESSLASVLTGLGFPLFIIGISRLASKMLTKLKARYVYPRTGYVKYRRETGIKRFNRALLVSVPIAGVTILITAFRIEWEYLLPVFVTAVATAGSAVVSQKIGTPRIAVYSLSAFLLALVLSFFKLPMQLSMTFIILLFSLLPGTVGIIIFRRYLATAAAEGEDDRDE